MGGKRVCLGKTFAEVTTKFTVPLLFHFFDFEFTKHEQSLKKENYSIAGKEEIPMLMKLIIKNKI